MCGVADTALYDQKPGSSGKGAAAGTSARGNEGDSVGEKEAKEEEKLGQMSALGSGDENKCDENMECDSTENKATNQTSQSVVTMATDNAQQEMDVQTKVEDGVSSTQQDNGAVAESGDRTESKQSATCAETSEINVDMEKK